MRPGSNRGTRAIKTAVWIAGIIGLALATYLIVEHGAADIWRAMVVIGWGLVAVSLFHIVRLVLNTLSWRCILPAGERPDMPTLVWIRWIRESVNNLLPVGQVGGDLVCIRLAHQKGVRAAPAIASMVVDLSVGILAQLVFITLGLVVLLAISNAPLAMSIASTVLIGMAILMMAIGGFLWLQKAGLFGLVTRIAAGLTKSALVSRMGAMADEIDARTRAIYRDRRMIWPSLAWRIADWTTGTIEVWLLLYFLDKPVSLAEAMILASLVTGVRAAAFLVPGAIGVLEGSFIVFGSLFGLSPSDSLAVVLGKRVRELLIGAPGLVAWQLAEGRRFLARTLKARAEESRQ